MWGEEEVEKLVDIYLKNFQEEAVVFKGDVNLSIVKWLPRVMIKTYKKIIDDFKKELSLIKK